MQTQNVLNVGTNCVVRWDANPKGSTPVKSNHVNGKRTKKIVLPDLSGRGAKPKPGESWVCRVERLTSLTLSWVSSAATWRERRDLGMPSARDALA